METIKVRQLIRGAIGAPTYHLEPIIGFQLWSTYTFGTAIYNAEQQRYEEVDNRLNTQIRRTRLGIKGQAYDN